jgi:hypothetical protein
LAVSGLGNVLECLVKTLAFGAVVEGSRGKDTGKVFYLAPELIIPYGLFVSSQVTK